MLAVKFENDPCQHKEPSQLSPKSQSLLVSYTTCITIYIYVTFTTKHQSFGINKKK